MSDEAALLKAIYANYDDDTPRLVYADWLEEHGDPARAEFVRVQIAISRAADGEESRTLYRRQQELLNAHRARWVAELEVDGRVGASFDRGFVDTLDLSNGTPADLDVCDRVPGLRHLTLEEFALTAAAVRRVAAMDLDSLTVYDSPFRRPWLPLLEPLPLGTVLKVYPRDFQFGRDAWNNFQEKRLARLAALSAAERRAEGLRWLRGHDTNFRPGDTRVSLSQQNVCDAEMQLLTAVPEVEEFYNTESDLTATGLERLAALPNLKSVELYSTRVESIAPLARCTRLEKLELYPEYEIVVGDDGTDGLEKLVDLRRLSLREGDGGYGERTLARLAPLRKLTSLDIDLGEVGSEDSYAALSHLTALEQLSLGGRTPGGALRFLAPLRKLRTLSLSVNDARGDDFAPLGALTELHALYIGGESVTDLAVGHFAPLTKLRTVMAQHAPVTAAGARALAAQLPGVTIVLDKHVIKSPRPRITFRRCTAGERASALLPEHWPTRDRHAGPDYISRVEDGWENIGGWSGGVVGPGEIRLYVGDEADPAKAVSGVVRNNSHLHPKVSERDVVKLTGEGASCVFAQSGSRHLVAAVATDGGCAVLDCQAPPTRFAEFRPLFEYVARSLRVGKAASKGVGEEKVVAASRL